MIKSPGLVPFAVGGGVLAGGLVTVLGITGSGSAVTFGTLIALVAATCAGLTLIVARVPEMVQRHRQLIGASLLIWVAGQLWTVITSTGTDPGFPVGGDVVSFLAGAPALVGTLLVLRVRPTGPSTRLGIDALVLGLALASPTWQIMFNDAPAEPDRQHAAALAVLVLLGVVVGLALLAYLREFARGLLVLSVGVSAFAVGKMLGIHALLSADSSQSWAGAALIAFGWPLMAAAIVRYRPSAAADPDDWSAEADTRGMQITTTTSLALLVVSLIALVIDRTPDRTSIGLVALAILMFWVRELLNVRSRGELLYRLHDEATADPLTGLANRRVLAARMRTLPEGEPWCLLTVDLDGFKDVNDLLGHATGDDLLSAVARRLRESAPPGALVSRIGGDEFAVLLQGGIDVGERVGGAIVTAVRQSAADVEGVARVEVSASVGVAAVHRGGAAVEVTTTVTDPSADTRSPARTGTSGQDPTGARPATIIDLRDHASSRGPVVTHSPAAVVDPLSALSASGAALRVAKAAGRNRVEVYDEEIATIRRRRLRVEERLRVAVETDAITVRFQPIVDLRRGVVAGAEALARWEDPELGRVDPGEFITVAEQTGLVVALGERVLEETLSTGVRERLFERGLRLSWNVSPVQLRVAGFDRVVHEAIAAHKVPRELLVMEVTEQVLVEEGQAAQTLHRIAKLGVTIAIDDFGTGYSALGYLHRLPADILKIDQSLTSSLVAEPRSRAITRAVLDLGRTVGLSVVVEGVASDQIHDLVRRMGVGYGQGMHYGPAMSGAELAALADRLAPTGSA